MVKLRKAAKAKKKTRTRAAPTTREIGLLGNALRALGTAGGTAVGSYFGNPLVGGSAGGALGAAISKWLGAGDYRVSANSIVQRSLKSADSIPMMHNESQSVTIRHREYLGEIRGNTSFTIDSSYQLNPGNSSTFPWLSGIANKFQEYRVKGAVYHYVPTSGSAISSTNAALGSVMISTSYRANDSPPSSKTEMLNEYCSNEAMPSEPFCHPIECDPKENPFNVMYVRTGDVPSEDSRLMYDLGVTYVAVSGQQATGNVLGDLWLTYEIELKKPIVASNVTSTVASSQLNMISSSSLSALFTGTQQIDGTLGVTYAGNTIALPVGAVGDFLIVVRVTTGTAWTGAVLNQTPTYTNCAPIRITPGGNQYSYSSWSTATGSPTVLWMIMIRATDPKQPASVIVPTFTLTGGTISYAQVNISPAFSRS